MSNRNYSLHDAMVMYRISSSTSIESTMMKIILQFFILLYFYEIEMKNEMKIQLSLMPMSIISYQVSIGFRFANKSFES